MSHKYNIGTDFIELGMAYCGYEITELLPEGKHRCEWYNMEIDGPFYMGIHYFHNPSSPSSDLATDRVIFAEQTLDRHFISRNNTSEVLFGDK